MKTLKGTEKQVAWATSIREDAINTLEGNIKSFSTRNKKAEGLFNIEIAVWTELRDMVVSQISEIDSAEKIIEIRHRLDPRFLGQMVDIEVIKRRRNK